MTDSPVPAEKGLIARAIGTIFSPGLTFRSIVASPRPAGILFLVCLVMGLSTGLPQFSEQGRRSALDMQVRQIEQFSGQAVSPETYTQLERQSHYSPYFAIGGVFVALPFFTILFAAIYWFFFNVVLGGTAHFKQVLGVLAHSQVITALGALLAAPIQAVQGIQSAAGPFNLGALAPMLEPNSILASFLGAITFFSLWQVIVSGIGLSVLYRRSTGPVVIGLLLFYLGLTAAVVAGFSSMSSSLSNR